MNICFLGSKDSFEYLSIGGSNSIVRRLAVSLADAGHFCTFLHFGYPTVGRAVHRNGIQSIFLESLSQAVGRIGEETFDHVVVIHIPFRQRLDFLLARRNLQRRIRFHFLFQSWNEFSPKRILHFVEARIYPYNGWLFGISPRIHRYLSQWHPRTALLLPPVAASDFASVSTKRSAPPWNVAFAGRIATGKGIENAIRIFTDLAGDSRFHFSVYGITWEHVPETMELRQTLERLPHVTVKSADFREWTPDVEEKMAQSLKNTDVLLLPYRKLSSTVDMPLLLLEGMAQLCAVCTPDLGNLPEIYGPSPFYIPGTWDHARVVDSLGRLATLLPQERHRLFARNQALRYSDRDISQLFLNTINKASKV